LKKWEVEEHGRFLEALKLFGKDWPKVQKHVRSKSIKNVISHAQKFHLRLVSIFDQGKTLLGITQEEAEYFREVLGKKLNRCTIEREKKEAETIDLQKKGFLFRVDKIKRRVRRVLEPEP